MAASLISLVGDYLFQTRINAETATAESLAAQFAPLLAAGDAEALYARARAAGRERNGRLIVLDMDGKVQTDTFSALNGKRLGHPEIVAVQTGAADADYGFHLLDDIAPGEKRALFDFLRNTKTDQGWVGYFSAALEHGGRRVGILLCSISVQDMVVNLRVISDRMLLVFFAAALSVFLVSIVFSRIITKPIAALTEGIKRMARGDLSGRVKVTGRDEMARLGQTFNQMSEKLEHLDASRNEFVTNASHELKTPLATTKILLQSILYQEGMTPELREEFLSDIDKELDRMGLIVSDLLTLVQADSREYTPEMEPVVLREIIEETISRLRPLTQERKQKLETALAADCPMRGDPIRLAQVVYNLVDNAIKYTPPGGRIRVALRAEGKLAVLEVSDTGPGIPKADQVHIFDRFYRVDKARSRATGGNGLGLSIVHQAVMLHEGSVSIRSEEGKGATFRVELPMV